ncbi:MAG: UDP-N-acetylmuramoyl-tripeptide--D-alanyl-D-alanine ligase [Actinomycetota bacterium]|nr:UDP-N-acetylmuramoyl-tripeptide--D-alanyl-D-alanine ligase [Actinomycetota bacterium]
MIALPPDRLARAAGLEVVRTGGPGHPRRAEIDSRLVAVGDFFFGLPGASADGGEFAAWALRDGAWGVAVGPDYAGEATRVGEGWVFVSDDPLASLQALAREWRRELGARVVGITGSTGKTSVKDIAKALLPDRLHASRENFNTEIGLPLTILEAEPGTEVLILEMAMRGMGQIAELCKISEPDIAAITNVGPVHLELLGTLDAIVEAKAEILAGLGPGGIAVIPADAEALAPHLSDSLRTLTFGEGGDVSAVSAEVVGRRTHATLKLPGAEQEVSFPFTEPHNLLNGLAAFAIGIALDADPREMAGRTASVTFSRLRGEVYELPDGITLVNDCYNANPVSMRAALESLAATPADRRLAVLGGMAELGPSGVSYHREVADLARELGIGPVIGVGDLARDYSPDEWVADPEAAAELAAGMLQAGDAVLVKGSRSVGLEAFTESLLAKREASA